MHSDIRQPQPLSAEAIDAIRARFWRKQGKTPYEIQLPEEPDSAAVDIGITALKDAVRRGRGRPRK